MIIVVSISFWWNFTNAKKEQERIALLSARSFFDHIVITRIWNARHGGVYAPVTEQTQPNPYLDTPMREIEVNETLTLTKINPAFMTRQLSEIAMEQEGVKFHITSRKPLRQKNKPTPREEQLLKEFEQGVKEKGMFIKEGEKTSYFYMAPLIAKESCLDCHARQGYKVGEIRGGISVTTPFVMNISFLPLLLGHLALAVLGLLGIVFATHSLRKAYATIQHQAIFDALTGVPNRRSFSENILAEFKRSKRNQLPLSAIMCDVDNFKAYNDTYGHNKGDTCLKKVAQAVQKSLKRPGDFCARY